MENRGPHFYVPLSAFVGTATIGKAIRADTLFRGKPPADSDRLEHQLYAWPMMEPRPIVPAVPCRGAQGFWNVPADLEKEINAR
jgi:hypothetical protein